MIGAEAGMRVPGIMISRAGAGCEYDTVDVVLCKNDGASIWLWLSREVAV
jgi:hypothetical protein